MLLAFFRLCFDTSTHYGMTREWLRNNRQFRLGNICWKCEPLYYFIHFNRISRYCNRLNRSYKNWQQWAVISIANRRSHSFFDCVTENLKKKRKSMRTKWMKIIKLWQRRWIYAHFLFYFLSKTLHKTWFANNKSVNKTPAHICNSELLSFVFVAVVVVVKYEIQTLNGINIKRNCNMHGTHLLAKICLFRHLHCVEACLLLTLLSNTVMSQPLQTTHSLIARRVAGVTFHFLSRSTFRFVWMFVCKHLFKSASKLSSFRLPPPPPPLLLSFVLQRKTHINV